MKKLTVAQLVQVVKSNFHNREEQIQTEKPELFSMIVYMLDQKAKGATVPKKELLDLVKSLKEFFGESFILPAFADEKPKAENSSKKLKRKEEPTAEKQAEEVKEEPVKESHKKGSIVTFNEKKGVIYVESFAEEFTDAEGVKYVRADDITSMKDLLKEDLEKVVFAFFHHPKHLKKFGYSVLPNIKTPKEFPNNVDLASALWVSEDNVVTYAISMYSEVIYTILPDEFEAEDGVRYSGGVDYQIYRMA